MTWLSRLLPNGRSSLQRATKRRRRMMSLEALEHRIVLSNVTVSFPTPSSPLTITGDTFNDNFTITENTTPGSLFGTVTVAPGATRVVPGVGVVPPSMIDCRSPGHHQLRLRHPVRTGQDHADDRQERHRHVDRGQSDFRRE